MGAILAEVLEKHLKGQQSHSKERRITYMSIVTNVAKVHTLSPALQEQQAVEVLKQRGVGLTVQVSPCQCIAKEHSLDGAQNTLSSSR